LPVLMFSGMSPLAANITSAVALFPGQVSSGYAGRKLVSGTGNLSFRGLILVSIAGGIVGALLLLNTPSTVFTKLVPWLVLFATTVFAWGSFRRKPVPSPTEVEAGSSTLMGARSAALTQFVIAIYGGYFGGGIGFLMLAALTLAGLPMRNAGATKNALAGVMNAAAVAMLVTSPQVHWAQAVALGAGAIAGGLCGSWALRRVNDKLLRAVIVGIGVALTVGLFLKPL
jgi:uncharacterized membrane protein YfcA